MERKKLFENSNSFMHYYIKYLDYFEGEIIPYLRTIRTENFSVYSRKKANEKHCAYLKKRL